MLRLVRNAFSKIQICSYKTNSLPGPHQPPTVLYSGIFINNEWHKSKCGETFEVLNPATGKIITEVQKGGKQDIDLAIEAANEAFKFGSEWRALYASERGRLLYKLADLIERDATYIASLETFDVGKPYINAFTEDIKITLQIIRYYAGWADKYHGKVIPMDGNFFAYTRTEPVGVCGQITPWNYPMVFFAVKLAPALAMGNTVVIKPSELAPLTNLYMAEISKEAGFPAGVINVVPGFGDAGAALVENTNVHKIAFTGSTKVGKIIQTASGKFNLKRTTLELGGSSPIIILADAELNMAVEFAHKAAFTNSGQVCSAASKTFIEDNIYDEFVERSLERAEKRVVGDPFDPKTEQGSQISEVHLNRILYLVKKATKQGGKLLHGGQRLENKGYFMQPTLLTDVEDDNVIAKEEIFGPVQQLNRFKSLNELIERTNSTNYGLAAGIISNDFNRVQNIIPSLKVGTVWVNCYNAYGVQVPFGGYKDSGIGRELGEYGLRQYTEIKSVITAMSAKNS